MKCKMDPLLILSFLLGILILSDPKAVSAKTCEENHEVYRQINIGAVIDLSSRIGKEQKIAMEMAVDDSTVSGFPCFKLQLHFRDSRGSSALTASHAIELLNNKRAEAILGGLTLQEAAFIWEFNEPSKDIPIISLMPTSSSSIRILPHPFVAMNYNIEVQMQCIAAIVSHFRWRKVIAIYERSNGFSGDSSLITHLSDSLRAVGSVVEHHFAFPHLKSLSEDQPEEYIERILKKLRSKTEITVFSVLQCSFDFARALFKKAKEMGMMEKGYVWIISDDIASLLDSIDSSIIVNYMQGVIGFKERFVVNDHSFKSFERRFSRKYRTEYPDEEEDKHSSPSIHALKAYDATMATARARQTASDSNDLIKHILASNFQGLSGNICFKNGSFVQNPIFEIINLVGRSYREIGMWIPQFGLMEESNEHIQTKKMKIGNDVRLDSIYWPGGETNVPKGRMLSGVEKPLRIGVPAMGAFKQFVNVTYDSYTKQTTITGFSVQVFEAAVRRLPYHLPYVLVPFYGSYDEMVAQVHNKTLDGAVGDTEIMADRFKKVDFTHPYMDSGLVMVVRLKLDMKQAGMSVLKAFSLTMWIVMASMTMLTGFVIWFNEYVNNNPDFRCPFPQIIGAMLWFSVTVLSFNQREPIQHNLSRLVLSTWLFVTVIVTACFTAAVNSIMTVPKLQASIDIDSLLGTGATVGCNGNSFIVRYLTDVLEFKPENIRKISSINDYPKAFQTGDIKAAFFVVPHARIFLSEHCNGYTMAGPSYKLGGFGFVFEKGAKISADISEAILEVTQSGTINQLEKRMLYFSDCSSSSQGADTGGSESDSDSDSDDGPVLGIENFYILFLIAGGLLTITFLNAMWRLAVNNWPIHGLLEALLMGRGIYRWISMLLLHLCTKFGTRRFFRQPIIIDAPNNQLHGNGIELVRGI